MSGKDTFFSLHRQGFVRVAACTPRTSVGDPNANADETLAKNGCPVRTFKLARLDEESLGELLMHFMLETIIAAQLLGISRYALERRLTRVAGLLDGEAAMKNKVATSGGPSN